MMRICIPATAGNPTTGKGFFCARLAKKFRQNGLEVISNPEKKHDITLNIVKVKGSKGKINVTRLDGVYFNTAEDYKKRNDTIKKNLHKSDAIIYQSKFGLKMCNQYLGKFKGPKTIILNGADPDFYSHIKPIQSDYKYGFIAISRWRPHKRLNDIIESFLLADINNSCLYIAGSINRSGLPPKKTKKLPKRIIFLGSLSQKVLAAHLLSCKASIHLCWIDCCPNSVVEAIAAEIPVISNNVGGTRELVEPSGGIVCNIDAPFHMKPCKLYSPPKINRNIIAEAMIKTTQEKLTIKNKHIQINQIATQYLNFFRSL